VAHAIFRGGNSSLHVYCNTSPGTVSLSDSSFEDGVIDEACGQGVVSMQRNEFGSESVYVPAVSVVGSYSADILLSGTNKNTFTGTGNSRTLDLNSAAIIPSGYTWSIDGSSNVVVSQRGNSLEVAGELDLGAGTIWKTTGALTIDSSGTLNVDGSESSPVIFTSYKDDSFGGDTNHDGASSESSGDYVAAIQTNDGAIDISYATFRVVMKQSLLPALVKRML